MPDFEPSYVNALADGRLERRARTALKTLSRCELCPRRCRVDRTAGETGFCRAGASARVASFNAHFGEEAPLVGEHGSGTIFFSGCNLLCNFCQNYEISHGAEGTDVSAQALAGIMLGLQQDGCHNINLVTPSHVVPQILAALVVAATNGLRLPIVYNTGGYDAVETLRLLDGIVDIYMPDFKFWDPTVAEQTCSARDYPAVARAAVTEMHRQVGDLIIDETSGLAQRGLLVRHLVLPDGLAGTAKVMDYLATTISPETYVNVMAQYRPCGRAREIESLAKPLDDESYRQAVREARDAGITRLDRPRRVFTFW